MPISLAQRSVRVLGLLSVAHGLMGCGATGLAWVGEADFDSAAPSSSASNSRWNGPVGRLPSPDQEAQSDAHPRLAHTVTLGEVDVAAAEPGTGASAAPGLSVTINNYNPVTSPTSPYGYYTGGGSRFSSGFFMGGVGNSAPRPSGAAPQPGQNWPAIADHGTSFPFHSAPASPFR